MINIEELTLSILTKTTVIPEFKSKDGDLNEFLMQEAKDYHYPAVKIGRLAVSENYAHQGIGEQILQYVKALFAFGNRSGCRFLTVDAYADAVSFYENKGDFKFFTETDINDDTRLFLSQALAYKRGNNTS